MRRSLIALLTASTLAAPPSGLFQPLWDLLSGLWGGAYTKAGPGADPDGRSLPTQPATDAGPGADPSGRSLTAPQPSTDAGAGWDPDGYR